MKKLLLIIVAVLSVLPLMAKSYGDNIYEDQYRYVVTCDVLNVRSAPISGKVVSNVRKGDYIYGKKTGNGWIRINGGDWYVSSKFAKQEINPNFGKQPKQEDLEDQIDMDRAYRIQTVVRWCLLALCIIAFIICIVKLWDKIYSSMLAYNGRCRNEMHQKYYYDYKTYLFILTIAALIVGAILIGVLGMLLIGGAAFLVMGAFWLILKAIIIVAWIAAIGGVIGVLGGIFGDEDGCGIAIGSGIVSAVGFGILRGGEAIEETGKSAINSGFTFFNHLNMLEFAQDLFIIYWKPALIIAAVPLVLFLAFVILNLIVSWIFMLSEYIVMRRYNIKNPCPMCQRASEPAIYLSDGQELPVNLRPGRFGLFTIHHPKTNEKMPTMLFNGKGKLSRKCKNCGEIISADMGTEKHIAMVGVAESGKTTLVYRMIASMFNTYGDQISFTDSVDINMKSLVSDIVQKGYMDDFPDKTPTGQRRSVQLRLNRSMGMKYRIYINDVGGELYNMTGGDKEDAKQTANFIRNMETVLFIIDPITTDFSDCDISSNFEEWIKERDKSSETFTVKVNIKDAFKRFMQLVESQHLSKKEIHRINLNVVFVKKDLGYLPNYIDHCDSVALREFMQESMGFHDLVSDIEAAFGSEKVTYTAVSALGCEIEGNSSSNTDKLVATILSQLGINK